MEYFCYKSMLPVVNIFLFSSPYDSKQQRRSSFLSFAELHQSRVFISGKRNNKLCSLAGHILQNIITVKECSSKIPPVCSIITLKFELQQNAFLKGLIVLLILIIIYDAISDVPWSQRLSFNITFLQCKALIEAPSQEK